MPPEALKFLEDARLAILRVREFTGDLTGEEYAANALVQAAIADKRELLNNEITRLLDEGAASH